MEAGLWARFKRAGSVTAEDETGNETTQDRPLIELMGHEPPASSRGRNYFKGKTSGLSMESLESRKSRYFREQARLLMTTRISWPMKQSIPGTRASTANRWSSSGFYDIGRSRKYR